MMSFEMNFGTVNYMSPTLFYTLYLLMRFQNKNGKSLYFVHKIIGSLLKETLSQ